MTNNDLNNLYSRMEDIGCSKPFRIDMLTSTYEEHKELLDEFISTHSDVELNVQDYRDDFYDIFETDELYKNTLAYHFGVYNDAVNEFWVEFTKQLKSDWVWIKRLFIREK